MSALTSVYVKNNEEEEEKGSQGRERDRKEAPSNGARRKDVQEGINVYLSMQTGCYKYIISFDL